MSLSLKELIKRLNEGINIDKYTLFTNEQTPGRFSEEINLDIYIAHSEQHHHLLYLAIYLGNPPHYKPWAEFHNINNELKLDNNRHYFGSPIEEKILSLFSQSLGPAGKIYIEYDEDQETAQGLSIGLPPTITRLGYQLFQHGFTWFKDWYFPEGGSEGGQKIQGELPKDPAAKKKQMQSIQDEIKKYLNTTDKADVNSEVEREAIKRAEKILQSTQ